MLFKQQRVSHADFPTGGRQGEQRCLLVRKGAVLHLNGAQKNPGAEHLLAAAPSPLLIIPQPLSMESRSPSSTADFS